MSLCVCPHIGLDGIDSGEHKKAVSTFLQSISSDGFYADSNWSLLSLIDLYQAGNDLRTIEDTIPFRGGTCSRTMKCCGICTRRCKTRCVHDCLHRLYMWKKLVENTPEDELEQIPISIRFIVNQRFESHAQLSWVVGDILSRSCNTVVDQYMKDAQLFHTENPYKLDYSPQLAVDPATGKRIVNPATGELTVLEWPKSGLCPYCLPKITHDRRYQKYELGK